jgi:uncharacterized repeat protein (TIGR02543 family)
MAKFGDYVAYDGLIYRIVAVSEDAEPTYTLEPMRKSEAELKKIVDASQSQFFLVPSDDGRVEGIAGSAITVVGSRTALANALADGYVRVKFDVDGGSLVDSQIIVEGAKATKPNDPTKEHYTFDAWYHDAGFTNAVNFAVDEFDDSATLYAKWTPVSYTVTFEAGEGLTDPEAQTITYGNLVTAPVAPSNPGYILTHWSLDVDGEEPFDFTTDIIKEDTKLYAQWAEAVTVTFESNGGSEVSAQIIPVGSLATEPEPPNLDDNTFVGWFTDNNTFENEFDFATTIIDDNITLYAKWEAV